MKTHKNQLKIIETIICKRLNFKAEIQTVYKINVSYLQSSYTCSIFREVIHSFEDFGHDSTENLKKNFA